MLSLKGKYIVEHRRRGLLLERFIVHNDVTSDGKNAMLNRMFNAASGTSNWYIGLIDNSGFTAVAEADTYTSHAGWTEATIYTAATRPAWTKGSATAKTITNSTPVTFTINATGALAGFFLSTSNVKGETTGSATLWSTAIFGAVRNVVSGDTVSVTYVVSIL